MLFRDVHRQFIGPCPRKGLYFPTMVSILAIIAEKMNFVEWFHLFLPFWH